MSNPRVHPPETRAEAARLHKQGWTIPRIARHFGASQGTIKRWLVPGYREHQNRIARNYKERNRGTCKECGNPVWIGSSHCYKHGNTSRRVWSRENIIEAIQRWTKEHGRVPAATDWARRGEYYPSASTVTCGADHLFQSWADAIEAAGYPRPKVGNKILARTKEREIAQNLRDKGLNLREIADAMHAPPSTIERFLKPTRNRKPIEVRASKPKKRTRDQRIADLRKAIEKEHDNQ